MDYDYTEEYEYWAMQGRKEGLPSFRKSGRVLKKRKRENMTVMQKPNKIGSCCLAGWHIRISK